MVDEKILNELQRISKLLALNLIKGLKTNERYQVLNDSGFQPKEIAELLRTTPNTVSVALTKIKKDKK